MDIGALGGLGTALLGLTTLFRMREKRLLKKLEIEAKAQEAMLERMHAFEFREHAREQKVQQLELKTAKLEWEYNELVKDYRDLEERFVREQQHANELRSQVLRMYVEDGVTKRGQTQETNAGGRSLGNVTRGPGGSGSNPNRVRRDG